MASAPSGRVGALEREGPCHFCGRQVSQYAVVDEPQRKFLEHEHPWCAQYTAIAAENGISAARNPKADDDEAN